MPWEATTMLEARARFIAAWVDPEVAVPFAELCRSFHISRPTGYKWLRRWEQEPELGFADRSRAPAGHPNAVPEALVEEILACRAQHPSWGPRKLVAALRRLAPDEPWPVASTVGALLQRRGLTRPHRRRDRLGGAPPLPLTEPTGCNEVWAVDFKGHFALRAGPRCHPLTITDSYSRALLRCQGLPREDYAAAQPVFIGAFREFGLPAVIRSDNGPPFAASGHGLTNLTRLSAWWLRLGIRPERIAPAHPEQNGRHERLHGTLKAEATRPPQRNLPAQQLEFDRFRHEYNWERPHEGIGYQVPADLYVRSPRPYPAVLPELAYPAAMTVRQVRNTGYFRWRGSLIFLSEALAGEPVGLLPLDDRHWAVYYSCAALAILDDATGRWLPPTTAAPYLSQARAARQL